MINDDDLNRPDELGMLRAALTILAKLGVWELSLRGDRKPGDPSFGDRPEFFLKSATRYQVSEDLMSEWDAERHQWVHPRRQTFPEGI